MRRKPLDALESALESSEVELGWEFEETKAHEGLIPSPHSQNDRPPETASVHSSVPIAPPLQTVAQRAEGLEFGTQTGATISSNSQLGYAAPVTLETGATTGVAAPVAPVPTLAGTATGPCGGNSGTGQSGMASDQFVAECWGCAQQVSLPVYTSVFRCGHCGALSYDYELSGAPAESQPRKQRRRGWIKFRDRLTVVLVLLLISVVITGGPLGTPCSAPDC